MPPHTFCCSRTTFFHTCHTALNMGVVFFSSSISPTVRDCLGYFPACAARTNASQPLKHRRVRKLLHYVSANYTTPLKAHRSSASLRLVIRFCKQHAQSTHLCGGALLTLLCTLILKIKQRCSVPWIVLPRGPRHPPGPGWTATILPR